MKAVILRPYDDKDIVEVFIVEHITHPNKDFEKDYEKALAAEKATNPEEWQVNDVFDLLEKQGWQILKPDTIELEY